MHDDPGKRKEIAGKGQKNVERKLDTTKSGITDMFAGTASGTLLPPYVVYKYENMWDTWRQGGPKGSRFNRSQSGWFDKNIFEDWFYQIALPYLKKKNGTKVFIGDNLASHIYQLVFWIHAWKITSSMFSSQLMDHIFVSALRCRILWAIKDSLEKNPFGF